MALRRSTAAGDGVGQEDVRQQNRELVLTLLARHGALERLRLANETGLARPSVSRIVGDLREAGWVTESAPRSDGARGRPRTTVRLCPDRAVIFGVDVRLDGLLIQARDLAGAVLAESRHAMAPDDSGERAIGLIVRQVVADCQKLGKPPAGIGMAIGAKLDQPRRIIVESPYRPWRNVPIASQVAQRVAKQLTTAAPQVAMADVSSCAAVANWQEVSASDPELSTLVHLQIGIGAGAGVVERHLGHAELIAGPRIAHIPLRRGGPRCVCGARGCFDAVAGFDALVRSAADTGITKTTGPRAIEEFCAALQTQAQEGGAAARRTINAMAELFAHAAAALINITQPSRFTYAGYPILLGEPFLNRFLDTLQPYIDTELEGPSGLLAITALGDRASITGAYWLALRSVIRNSLA